MTTQYDAVVFIGRFQPLHNAHLKTIKKAFEHTKKVIIIVGSSYQPRTYKNPFFEYERAAMISCTLNGLGYSEGKDFYIRCVKDFLYDDERWAKEIIANVNELVEPTDKVALIGHKKDSSSFYLDMFPNWEKIYLPLLQNLSSQNIRELYFNEEANLNFIVGVIPFFVFSYLEDFQLHPDFAQIVRERLYIEKYKSSYISLPYPPIFVTADAVVFAEGCVLMIQRKNEPGKGLYALPGGFVDANEDSSIKCAAFRELEEETGLKFSIDEREKFLKNMIIFDAMGRSSRGRIVTHAFVFVLPSRQYVEGSSDALKAEWVSLDSLDSRNCFEDHFEIISICGQSLT
jgi:bifunctional NMN adenylyltransferase/nudix hydrolase